MSQIPSPDGQLDRLEGKVDQVLDRLTRMEERQNSHGAKIDAHDQQLQDHSSRIRDVEMKHAVAVATTTQRGQRLLGRWAAIGAVALVILGSLGTFVGNAIIEMLRGGT